VVIGAELGELESGVGDEMGTRMALGNLAALVEPSNRR